MAFNVCQNCKHGTELRKLAEVPAAETGLVCRRFPPTPIIVPAQGMDIRSGRKGMVPSLQHLSPNVAPDWTCGEFMAKLAVAN